MTTRLAAFIPVRRRAAALDAIKALHTIIFASVGGAIGLFVWDGLRQRRGRRAAIALGIVLTESALYVSNNQVCPLTPLAEELGAERGSVADIFLPDGSPGASRCSGAARWCWSGPQPAAWLGRRPVRRPDGRPRPVPSAIVQSSGRG
jgi:hypothetical protein